MNTVTTSATQDAVSVLRELCRPLRGGAAIVPACTVVQPKEIPHPADALLVHHEHMTEVLQRHYCRPVNVNVLDEHLEGDVYTRKVSLCPAAGGPVVGWGIVRLDFRYMSTAIREEILARQTPLGTILINHDIHRRIKPKWFLQFPARGPMLSFFGDSSGQQKFGRIGTIYCNNEPAIELLEIVTCAPAI